MSKVSLPLDLIELTIEQIQEAFAKGSVTSEALTQAFLDRIAKVDPQYNAIVFLNPDALADARASDQRRASGNVIGPLDGVPVVVKETCDMVGFPTTMGWTLLYSKTGGVDLMPGTDSPVVARMKASGSVILGKTNVPSLSHSGSHANDSWAGPTFNSAGRQFLPGGSSAGTATAVGASLAVLGLAEETGGSIQNPASAQGLPSAKPTFALVPNAGVAPLSGNRDVVGPIAHCVRDVALTLDVLAGYTAEDPKTIAGVGHRPKGGYASRLNKDALKGKRIGLYGFGWRNLPLSDEATRLYQRAQGELKQLGAELVQDPFRGSGFAELRQPTPPMKEFDARGMESVPYDLDQYLRRLGPNAAIKSYAEFAEAIKTQDPFAKGGVLQYMPNLPDFNACLADPSKPPRLTDFVAAREAYLETFNDVMDREKLDALIFPQMRGELPPIKGPETILETTVCEINIAGLPGVTVPAGYYASGSPFCLIVVGRLWSEADILAYAYAYEQATHHRRAPKLD
ncbi:amidase [Bradyrhizobium sp. SYSU BS000235]|uniref:amidase n=1 Tax=Bradyrhizobium sp. SYSU BS000235 TaxID=3411332 RepID=UPI003C72FF95